MPLLDISLRKFLEFGAYAIPGVLCWYFLFRFQNRKALPTETVRDTFFIGTLSVVPLFMYQYAYTHWAPKLGTDYLSTLLQNQNILTTVLQTMIGFATLGVFFTLVIGGFTMFYSLFTKESFRNTLRSLLSEPLNFSATTLIFVFILLIDIALRTFTPFQIPPGLIGTTFILAMLEEYSKHLFVRLFDDHKIKSVANAVELSIIVALSFAFLENIIYFTNSASGSIQSVIIGRTLVSMLGHITFSAVFGYYYGISKFAKSVMHVESVETHAPAFPQWVYKIFRFKTHNSYKAQKIFEGLSFATLIHFVFNICLEYNFLIGVIPILVGGGYLIYRILNSDIAQREFALVGSKEMPEEDFEKLVWKVSVMKHLQNIKKEHPDTTFDSPGNKQEREKTPVPKFPEEKAIEVKPPITFPPATEAKNNPEAQLTAPANPTLKPGEDPKNPSKEWEKEWNFN
ncbi:MAG: PrsW family glutamic-type intramembrane protease [bacterium]|nr:PrsW family glutamic-type intramembrane protease [bacterium]